MNKKRIIIIVSVVLLLLMLLPILAVSAVLGVNAYVKDIGGSYIISPEEPVKLSDVDCIIVLGCKVKDNGDPSDMLADRLKRGIYLYKQGAAPKIIMSGDHGTVEYDEVNTMKRIAIDAGIPSSDVFMDHAGFSTYESMYRAKEIFGAEKVLIVTQDYHLYRSIYIAKQLGLDAYGVGCDYETYYGQTWREVREVLARVKDFGTSLLKPKPTYLGEAIPVSGNGDVTNDE